MCEERTCSNCGRNDVHAFGVCHTCYRYYKNHGVMRPLDMKKLHSRLKYPQCENCGKKNPGGCKSRFAFGLCEPCLRFYRRHGRLSTPEERIKPERIRVCIDCKSRPAEAKGRCDRCYGYFKRNGKSRPRWRDAQECINCKCPKGEQGFRRGRCRRCNDYLRTHGVERPESLWKRGPYGYCDCGKPATHTGKLRVKYHMEEMPMCDDCYVEYQRQVAWYGDGEMKGRNQIGACGDD